MKLLATTAALLCLLTPTYSSAQPRGVSMELLGDRLIPAAVNNHREVVGVVSAGGASGQPFYWSDRTGLVMFAGDSSGRATDINERSQVVGYLSSPTGEYLGFAWSAVDGLTLLGDFLPFAINANGDMAGICERTVPCVRSRSGVRRLDVLFDGEGYVGSAQDINDRGETAGHVFVPGVGYGAAFWDARGHLTVLEPGIGYDNAIANGINERGEIAGTLVNENTPTILAATWKADHAIRRSGRAESHGTAINRFGVVGGSFVSNGDAGRRVQATVTLPDGRAILLGAGQVNDLNDRGHVVGLGQTDDGVFHGVIWTVEALIPKSLHVATPNSASRWGINTRQRLAWTYEGDAPQFQIDISRDGGGSWDLVRIVDNTPGPSQNFDWTVTGPHASNARLRVTAVGDESASDVNDADITIADPTIQILLPNVRSVVFGSQQTIFIKHNLGAGAPVAIDVSGDDGRSWRTIAPKALTSGSVTASFKAVVDLTPTTQGRLKIRALDGSGAVVVSNAFAVVGAGPGLGGGNTDDGTTLIR